LWTWLAVSVCVSVGLAETASGQPAVLRPEARQQILRLVDEKAARSPIERKIDSQLLFAARMRQGREAAPGLPFLQVDLDLDDQDRVLVDIEVEIGVDLTREIESLKGDVITSHPVRGALRAWLPLVGVPSLAARKTVRFVRPAARALTNKVNTSQGDVRHGGPTLRSNLGVDGSGVTIGVLSDGVASLASLQGSGDIAGDTTVLPGQAGSGDEGSAILEIVTDLAPGATLLFATALGGKANFAANILALRNAGADVIVDDVFYFSESVFQDDEIAAAVDTVTADGALYFSSAGNSGNLNSGSSGTWEGDFVAGPGSVGGDTPHDFGGGVILNEILVSSPFAYTLHWSDPNGGSSNDYDLYMLDAAGTTIVAASTNHQNRNDDPFEIIGPVANDQGNHLVVVSDGAAGRYLHLDAIRGRLEFATDGQISGHSAARDALSVAAVDARIGSGLFNGSESVQTYSSDGPRRIFFNADGSAITPGVFDSTGGEVRQKPDLSAADCVQTATPGFATFCGTSAAAPHAAALTALLLEADPAATLEEIRMALLSTAVDIEAVGIDRDSGVGLVRGPNAGEALPECHVDADCSDDLFCTGIETCDANTCVPGAGDPCTGPPDPFCDESADACVTCLVDTDCDDTLFCTGVETCDAGSCIAGGGDPCVGGPLPFCEELLGVCLECLGDGDCDDTLFCTGVETCAAGSCVAGPGDPCLGTSDPFCDEGAMACFECGVDADCTDGVFCNGAEVCDAGACDPAIEAACPDGAAPICVEVEMECVACVVDTDCTPGQSCLAGTCVEPVPAAPNVGWLIVALLGAAGLLMLRERGDRRAGRG
jgi:hypothetical protein